MQEEEEGLFFERNNDFPRTLSSPLKKVEEETFYPLWAGR